MDSIRCLPRVLVWPMACTGDALGDSSGMEAPYDGDPRRARQQQHVFQTFEDARRVIRDWMQWYNHERPHQALGYRSPVQYRAQQVTQVA